MPTEIIGEVGTADAQRKWIAAQAELAIKHLKRVCGEPPPEMQFELRWWEHERGSYPVIVLTWEDGMRAAPADYLERCEDALFEYEFSEPTPEHDTQASLIEWPDDPTR
jgi:hypothetical protein